MEEMPHNYFTSDSISFEGKGGGGGWGLSWDEGDGLQQICFCLCHYKVYF